ncbi:mucin-associated surface protein (MASP), partial [Trypanosoma cruzi]
MKCVLLLLLYFTVPCLLLLSLCVDGGLVCAEGYTQVTGVMAMMMTGRVLLVCALCVLWCVAGGVHARDVDTNALGGCMASGVLGENGSHMPDGCNKTAITVPLRSVLPITAVEASAGKGGSAGATGASGGPGPGDAGGSGGTQKNSISSETSDAGGIQNNSHSMKTSDTGVPRGGDSDGGSAAGEKGGSGGGGSGTSTDGHGTGSVSSGPSAVPAPAPAAPPSAPGHSGGPSAPTDATGVDPSASGSDGEAGSSGTNSSNTTGESPTGESPTGDQTPAAAEANNSTPAEGPAGTTSGNGHKGQEKEEEE